MKIMLVCAGGMSTSIVMNQIKKWAEVKGKSIEVKAYGIGEYEAHYKEFQCILLGPQISYKQNEIKAAVKDTPVAVIDSMDYALGNVDNIIKKVQELGITE